MERFEYWTKQRVDAGLRRFINDIYDEQGRELPASLNDYIKLLPADDKRRKFQGRLYPPYAAVLRHYESFSAAWWSFGFLVEVKTKEPKYPLTPEREEMMRLIYRYKANGKKRPAGVPAGAKEYAESLGYPRDVGSKWAVRLGLANIKESPWSDEEIALLEKFGYLSVHHLKLLFKKHNFIRSETAIHLMRKRRMCAKATPYYSFNSLSKLLGVDSHKVTEWGTRGWLKYTMKGTNRVAGVSQNGDTRLTHKDWIYDFIVKHPKEFSIKCADQLWLFHILTKGEVGLGFSETPGIRTEGQQIEQTIEHRKKKKPEPEVEKNGTNLPNSLTYLRPVEELGLEKPHGTRLRYLAGCKCDLCRRANTEYQKGRERAQKRGEWNGLVSAEQARNHILTLQMQGIGRRAIRIASGICETQIIKIRDGVKKKIRVKTEQAILSVDSSALAEGEKVDAAKTWEQINWLQGQGLSKAAIAFGIGRSTPNLQIGKRLITKRVANEIEKFYLEIQQQSGGTNVQNFI